MGNCLVIQDRKEIKIMRVDGGKVLEMPSSPAALKVKQEAVLAAEPLTTGHIIPGSSALPAAAAAAIADPGAVRVKLVISKQELRKILDKEGMSLDDMVSAMRKAAVDDDDRERSEHECCGGWRPALESIPEGSGF